MLNKLYPNSIKDSCICCINCGKEYKTRKGLRKHEITCELLRLSKKKIRIEEEELPTYRELFLMLLELGNKYNNLEKKMEEMNKMVVKTKKKINIFEWLHKTYKPLESFDEFCSNIKITNEHIEKIIDISMFDLISLIIKDHINVYNKTNEDYNCPLFAFHLKKGIYVFNKTQTNENKDDISKFEKWEELTSFQLIKWAANLQMNIAKKFQNWKKENEDDIKSNEHLNHLCDKALIKIVTPEFKTDKDLNKLKLCIFNLIKTDIKEIIEYDFNI